MATNSGRGNSIGAEDGPGIANTPDIPAVPDDVKKAIRAQEHDPNSLKHGGLGSTGVHEGGEDAGAKLPPAEPGVETKEEVSMGGEK